jgi:phenylacetic acid degradation protein paaN
VLPPLFERHQETLRRAVAAAQARRYWSPYSDEVSRCGTDTVAGREALEAYRGAQFYLDQPGVMRRSGAEHSPYGLALSVSYPQCSPDALITAAQSAMTHWAKAGAEVRAGVCLEVLARLATGAGELGQALMHTTGQPYSLALNQGVVQALARGLEAVAIAWREMSALASSVAWERNLGTATVRVTKRFVVVPKGVSLVVGCSAAPTWMAFPAIFASLVSGNPVIIKPHPMAILPLAITVAVIRKVLKEAGFDSNLVSLLVDDAEMPILRDIATRSEIKLIDFAGGHEMARWLRENARQAELFAFSSASNCVVIDSSRDYKGMLRYLVGAMTYYSGQLPTSPQAILVPATGINTPEGVISGAQFRRDLGMVLGKLLDDPLRAAEILGAPRAETVARLDAARQHGQVVRDSVTLDHPHWPGAKLHTPLLLETDFAQNELYGLHGAGLVVHLVEAPTTASALAVAERVMRAYGGIELLVYSDNPNVLQLAEESALRVGVGLATNLSGTMAEVMALMYAAAFSDLQGGGMNPASTATLIDSAFLLRRFSRCQLRLT